MTGVIGRNDKFYKIKEAPLCAYAHNVPTPLINILDLIGYQMLTR